MIVAGHIIALDKWGATNDEPAQRFAQIAISCVEEREHVSEWLCLLVSERKNVVRVKLGVRIVADE